MSILDVSLSAAANSRGPVVSVSVRRRSLHRLAEVRRLQGITRRTIARRLNVDLSSVKLQEKPTSDIPLSALYAWQQVLEVPIAELLVDLDESLSAPILKRAQLVRLMKTAGAILERAQQPSIRRMAGMLVEQLCEMMPELKGVSPWHTVGRRRTQEELGQAAYRRFSTDVLRNHGD